VAFVIPASDRPADEIAALIIAHCRENLADFKVVREVHIVDSLPRSTLDKIAKNELRSLLPEITA
jgi:crotonobetaine/carnitine-CoA ligase